MENKTLQDFKEEIARERGFKDWTALFTAGGFNYLENRMGEVAERYATYKAEQACRRQGEAYTEMLSLNKAWPVSDVLNKLIEGVEILLKKHDYDGHGWEEYLGAIQSGKDIVSKMFDKESILQAPLATEKP